MTQLVYVGRRTLAAGKVSHGFAPLANLDQPSLFTLKGKTGYVVGGVYEAEARLDEHGQLEGLTVSTLRWTRQLVEEEALRAAWELADRQAYQVEGARLAVARVKRSPAYASALAPMLEIMRTAKSYAEAERVASQIKAELLDGWSR